MLERWFTSGVLSLTGLILAVLLFISVNLFVNATFTAARLDLTDGQLFSLSEGTRRMLGKIDEPITLRLYYSERLGREVPSFANYAIRVRDMLAEFAAAAGGRVELVFHDPEPYSETEDRAVAFGLQGLPIDRTGEQVYFGLAGTNSTDDVELIEFFQAEREGLLEYDLARLVYGLANPKKPVIGVSSTLPIDGDVRARLVAGAAGDAWIVMRQLRQTFDVRMLGEDPKEIDEDVDVLMLVHPTGLSEQALYAIDQFLLGGGKALVFVDPHAESLVVRPPMGPPKPSVSDLEKLFKAWGVELVDEKVVGDARFARRVNAGTQARIQPSLYLAWLAVDRTALNADDPVTSEIKAVNLASAGILRPLDTPSLTLTPLITSSADVMQLAAADVQGRPDVRGLLGKFKPDGQRYVIAARLSGIAQTAFPDGPPEAGGADPAADEATAQGGGEKQAQAVASSGPAADQHLESVVPLNVIVVADTDLLEDRFWVEVQDFFGQTLALPLADNGAFVINAVENLADSGDLIGLRSRGTINRPFERIEQMARAAEERLIGKEQELREKLQETEKNLAELQTKERSEGAVILSEAQQQAVLDFRREMLNIRRQLRAVQHDLRKDVDVLEGVLRFVNIALIPILVGCVAVALGLIRLARRTRHIRAAYPWREGRASGGA